MRRKQLALLIVPILLLGLLPGSAVAAGPSAEAQARAGVLAYWTPERMRSAKWLDVRYDPVAKVGRLVTQSQFQPTGTSNGSWNGTASNADDEMARVTGRVYFAFGASAYICSGSVIRDARTGYSTVLTAAHCVYDQKKGKFASQWMFIPDFDVNPTYTCASTYLGCWNAVSIVTRSEFTTARRLTNSALQHDWAFVVVGNGGLDGATQLDVAINNRSAGTATGLQLAASEQPLNTTMTAIGYPAAAPYDGKNLTYCQGPVTRDANTSSTTYKMACLMTGGSSGGPWVLDGGSGFDASATSLNSYGYTGDTNMYGPIFGSDTQATFNQAQTRTSGNIAINTN